jgi:hypothetical protein
MATRKVLLVGCRQGPWVPVADIKHPCFSIQPRETGYKINRQGGFVQAVITDAGPFDHITCEVYDAVG